MSEPTIQRVRFHFRLGEWTIFEAGRNMLVRTFEHADLQKSKRAEPELSVDLPDEVDGLFVASVPTESPLRRIQIGRESIRYVPEQFDRYFIEIGGTFAEYFSRFSAKSRSTLSRKIRRFAAKSGGEIDLREYKSPQEMSEYYRLARGVSAETYQELMFDMGLPTGEVFQRGMVAAAEHDSVRGYVLFFHGKPIAYLYCPVRDGVLLYQCVGHLRQFSDLSPGTVLLLLALERLHQEARFSLFDFTEGGQAGRGGHKEFFATRSHRCANVYYLRRSLSNLLLVVAHTLTDCLSGAVGRFLTFIGLKARVKKVMRAAKARLST